MCHLLPPQACADLDVRGTPSCASECSESGYAVAYDDDKVKATSSYSIRTVANIMEEIYTNGPVTVAFTVYEDFETYTSGVYQHVTGSSLGGHAVKMVGWGTDNGVDYWKIANSWNPSVRSLLLAASVCACLAASCVLS